MTVGGKAHAKRFVIKNRLGLHARAAAALVKITNRFSSDVTILKGKMSVNGKSIMGVLMLAAAKGSEIEVRAAGEDSSDALKAIGHLIDDKFGEAE